MKYYIIAGEASGDLHASNLIKAIKSIDSNAAFKGLGGDKMKAAGMELLLHYKEISFMGIAEVLQNLGIIRKALRQCENDLVAFKPDVLITVDYPGFNLRMVKFAKQCFTSTLLSVNSKLNTDSAIKTVYYISPKLWAWRSSRVEIIKKYVDKMISIFPFEEKFYKDLGYSNVDYVGNPLLDELKNFQHTKTFRLDNNLTERSIIALLPGSRKQEIDRCLPPMLDTAKLLPTYQFVIAGMNHTKTWIENFDLVSNVKTVYDQTYDLLAHSDAALVTSGTATLETAILNVPQVCTYRTSPLTYFVAKQVVKVPYISLVNLIANKEVIPELIQDNMQPQKLLTWLQDILPGGSKRDSMLKDYEVLREMLKGSGASQRAAQIIVDFAN